MLTAYETAVQQLLQLVNTNIVPVATLDSYINIARMQLAADAECCRTTGALTTAAAVRSYPFSSIVVSSAAGFGGVISARMILGQSGPLDLRSWEWFESYYLYLDGNVEGYPLRAGQLQQGESGTLFFSPIPNAVIGLSVDVAALPIPLVNDSTIEAIPYPWTDAVPFYAAGYAFMQLQRQADADKMFARYFLLAQRGRQESTPTVLPEYLPGGPGAHIAAEKTTLTMQPQAARGGR